MIWPTKKLGEVTKEIIGGGTPRRNKQEYWNGDIPWMTIEDINDNFYILKTRQFISKKGLENSNAKIIPPMSVILSCTASVGTVAINKISLSTNQQFNSFVCNKEIIPEFLAYILILKKNIIEQLGGVTTFPFISKLVIANLKIPLPPLEIQKQIVERMDKIVEAQKLNDKLIQKADELFQSLLQKELDPKDKNWNEERLGEICDVRDGTHESPKFYPSGIPLITSKNLIGEEVDFENINYISLEDHKKIDKRSKVDNGDILFGMIGTIGNPVIVKKDREFSIKNVGLIKPTALSPINYFIYYSLLGNFIQKQVKKFSRGGTQKFVSLGNLRNLKIIVPNKIIQRQIVEKLSAAQEYKKQLLAQKSKLKELFDSVLHKCMEGERV